MSEDEILEAMWKLPDNAPLLDRLVAWRPQMIHGKRYRETMIRALCAMANRPLPWEQDRP